MAKFRQHSISDESQGSFFNVEQMSSLVGDIFSQIYEQRAAASLATLINKPAINRLNQRSKLIAQNITKELGEDLVNGKLDIKDFNKA